VILCPSIAISYLAFSHPAKLIIAGGNGEIEFIIGDSLNETLGRSGWIGHTGLRQIIGSNPKLISDPLSGSSIFIALPLLGYERVNGKTTPTFLSAMPRGT